MYYHAAHIYTENTRRVSCDIKYQARLSECLFLISRGLPSDSTCVLKAEPGKLDIKRRKPDILFISLLQTSDYDVIFDFCIVQCH